jgi:uncharacterized repeat protein (TIGR04076 family)
LTLNRVEIRIARILEKGECPFGHKVGDEFIYPEDRGRICASAMHSIFPAIRVLQFGGSFPWEGDPDRAVVCCPDARNPVVFDLKRVEAE